MAEYIFQKIAKNIPLTIKPHHVRKAREWLRDKAKSIYRVNRHAMLTDVSKNRIVKIDENAIGTMVFYTYDPKLKDKLPYYDMFPLVIIVDIKPDGWTGLNLHYLPPNLRARLMDALYSITTEEDGEKKIELSYDLLKSVRRFRFFRPCFKRYLINNVQSRIIGISPSEWDMALMLPLQKFAKADVETVWRDSLDK